MLREQPSIDELFVISVFLDQHILPWRQSCSEFAVLVLKTNQKDNNYH